jgi:prepilin-type N-terminal cleavage/methylation domain-containing protein
MKLNSKSLRRSAKAGFSLVELLIVIAIIGIMASIAIPLIGKLSDNTKVARAKRNAQNIASVFNSAYTSGAYDSATLPTTVGTVIADLDAGKEGSGSFVGTTFKVPGIQAIEDAETKSEWKPSTYLTINEDALGNPTGTVEYKE